MWRLRVIQAATVTLAVIVVIAMTVVWLWRDRPTLESTGWAFAPPPPENPAIVTGVRRSDVAKITGMTPAVFNFSGKCWVVA